MGFIHLVLIKPVCRKLKGGKGDADLLASNSLKKERATNLLQPIGHATEVFVVLQPLFPA